MDDQTNPFVRAVLNGLESKISPVQSRSPVHTEDFPELQERTGDDRPYSLTPQPVFHKLQPRNNTPLAAALDTIEMPESPSKPEPTPKPLTTYTTKRGYIGLRIDGFTYTRNRTMSDTVYWKCSVKECKARIKTTNDFIPKGHMNIIHCHPLRVTSCEFKVRILYFYFCIFFLQMFIIVGAN